VEKRMTNGDVFRIVLGPHSGEAERAPGGRIERAGCSGRQPVPLTQCRAAPR